MTNQRKRPLWAIALAVFTGIFGLLTLKSGGEVLFIDGTGREAAGDYVPFIVWFNFLAGFAYILGAFGLFLWRSWITLLAYAIAVLTIVAFAALGIHILMDRAYEARTVGAMVIRSVIWLGIAFSLHKTIGFASGLRR